MTNEQWKKLLVFGLVAAAWVASLVLGVKLPNLPVLETPVIAERGITATLSDDVYIPDNLKVGKSFQVLGEANFTGPINNDGSLVFEGATANAYETTLAVTDPTADRTITFGNLSGYALIGPASGKYVPGVNTITGTLAVNHGLTTPESVFCTLLSAPVANAAHCSATISGNTVTVKTWKSDGTTAGSVGASVAWLVTGQP